MSSHRQRLRLRRLINNQLAMGRSVSKASIALFCGLGLLIALIAIALHNNSSAPLASAPPSAESTQAASQLLPSQSAPATHSTTGSKTVGRATASAVDPAGLPLAPHSAPPSTPQSVAVSTAPAPTAAPEHANPAARPNPPSTGPAPPADAITLGASCPRSGEVAVTADGKYVICWTSRDGKQLRWRAFF